PGNLNVRFPGLDADLVLAAVRPRLAAATGSACTSGTPEPSHVLRAMGLNGCEAGESIRLSLGRFTTLEDVDEAAIALIQATEDVRRGLA
ncbi:MAG: aminotransferase, partial [Mesorhizobium sp.]